VQGWPKGWYASFKLFDEISFVPKRGPSRSTVPYAKKDKRGSVLTASLGVDDIYPFTVIEGNNGAKYSISFVHQYPDDKLCYLAAKDGFNYGSGVRCIPKEDTASFKNRTTWFVHSRTCDDNDHSSYLSFESAQYPG
jgi:hypothetical protein